MLMKCPECGLQVSDKAFSCPHCGYPMKTGEKPARRRRAKKHTRLPNGFGQISEIKGRNLRKPFRAMVTVGKTDLGRPICKPLKPEAYFETYNDAYAALVEYNRNPYDLAPAITVKELYEKWLPGYEKTVKCPDFVSGAWPYCSAVHGMRAMDLRARHIKGCMEDGTAIVKGISRKTTASMKNRIKTLFNLMLDYAVEYEIVDRNYSRSFTLAEDVVRECKTAKTGHMPFSDSEMDMLWENVGSVSFVDVLLIQCYSGWRPRELGLIELADVDLGKWTFKGGIKTAAGIGRTVPIHERIRHLVEERYREAVAAGSAYLLNCHGSRRKSGPPLTYDRYKEFFKDIVKGLGLDPAHKPHDGRKHFVTMAKKYGVDEYAIKYIVGHSISDITEKIYTKREDGWLASEIAKIK